MSIKDHVTSLEMSKRLAKAGVHTPSIWCHVGIRVGDKWTWSIHQTSRLDKQPRMDRQVVRAYTASELGAMLPKRLSKDDVLESHYDVPGAEWKIQYRRHDFSTIEYASADTEANARAALLLKLIDAGHIDPSKETEAV